MGAVQRGSERVRTNGAFTHRPYNTLVGMEDHLASETRTTTDHEEIRRWVEEHDGKPVTVKGTESGDDAGVLRIDFPGGAGAGQLEPVSWDDWFAKFEESSLAFLYQERKASGEGSTFFKLIAR